MKKTILGTLIVISGAGVWFYRRPAASPTIPSYSVAKLVRGNLTRAVLTTGQLEPLVSVEVSTQISGQISEVRVDFNSSVKKGDILARIDPASYQQRLSQTKADLSAAQAVEELARITSERQLSLLKKSMLAQQDYDQSAAQLSQARATLLTREAAVENAQLDLERCTLKSPIDGIVIYKAADVGKTVQASFSAPTLFVIAEDLRRMRIIAKVSEADIWSVKPGQNVAFSVEALLGRTFHGILKQLRNPYTPADEQAGKLSPAGNIATFDAVIEVDNPDLLLLPSLTANVSIIVEERKDVLLLPNSALRVRVAQEFTEAVPPAPKESPLFSLVYVLPNGDRVARPRPTWVQLGIANSLSTEVLSGVNEGDAVVTAVKKTPLVIDVGASLR